MMKKGGIIICGIVIMLLSKVASAQTATDGFSMAKGEICLVGGYSQTTWDEYWEGTLLRENLNVGTFKSKMIMPMLGYGLSDKLNFFASLPYIDNSSTAGQMTGKKGIQDFSFDAKYKLVKKSSKNGTFYAFVTAGFSLPASNYIPDYLPYSIGLGAKTLSGRVIVHYEHKSHFFATAQTGYILKSKITTDRQSYYNEGQVNSNEMPVPDVWDGAVRLGYNNKRLRADIHYNWMYSTSGSDIRWNDMPYPFNQMNAQTVGIQGLLWIPGVKGLAVHGSYDQIVKGRNVGKATTWATAIQYVFNPFTKKEKKS
jgi:hypothetical protein